MSWQTVKLGDIIEIKKGSYITKKESKVGPYPVILGGQEPAYYIDKFNHTGKAIVISRSGASAGFVSFWNEPIFVTDGFLIEPQDTISIDFLYYLLKSKQPQLQGQQGGSAIPHVNPRIVNAIDARLPSLPVQNKIVSILSAYDDLIENNRKQIKLLEEAAQRLYKEWFVDLRFPGWETAEIVDGVPVGWRVGKAEDFYQITIGKTPPRAEKQWFVSGEKGIPWLSISDMGNSGSFIFKTSEGLTEEAVKKHNMKVVPAGTVFVSFKLTVGRIAIATTEMCSNEAIAHFYVNDSQRAYAYCYLKNFEYDTLGNTSSISKAVNSKIIKAMPFIMPSAEILQAFSDQIEPILNEIKNKQATCIKLAEARDRLLPKLMSGEVEV